MYEVDPTKEALPGSDQPAIRIYDDIVQSVDARRYELQSERKASLELKAIEDAIAVQSSKNTRAADQLRGNTERGEAADGKIQQITSEGDKFFAKGPREFSQHTHVFFANRIETSFARAEAEGTMLAARIRQPVDLVYVRTDGLQSDLSKAVGETFDPAAGKRNPPERALVTQLALDSVADHYREQSHPTSWIERHVAPRITVETFK